MNRDRIDQMRDKMKRALEIEKRRIEMKKGFEFVIFRIYKIYEIYLISFCSSLLFFFFSSLLFFLSSSLPLFLSSWGKGEIMKRGGGRSSELANTIIVETKDCLYYFS